jgi:hypothetical protein
MRNGEIAMSQEHEYALLGGTNRAKVGRYIGIASASISALIVFLVLAAVDVAKRLGVSTTLPPSVLSLVGAGAVFTVLYWLFDKYVWRWAPLGSLLKVPNLAGDWSCEGKTLDADGNTKYEWQATVTIVQTWDRLRVRLKTKQSGSNSVSAALLRDEVDGFVLLYHYKNDPRINEVDLKAHRGFAELTFSKDCQSAEGPYFNGHGRFTFGTMALTRIQDGA